MHMNYIALSLALLTASILFVGSAALAADEQTGKGAPAPIVGQPDADSNKEMPAPIVRKVGDKHPEANGGQPQPSTPAK
ncbi:MAG TPA: hypothetical protein V6D22_08525 [Candidatus Obscuribacterales bacterium]